MGGGGVGRLYVLVGGEEAAVQLQSSSITSAFSALKNSRVKKY